MKLKFGIAILSVILTGWMVGCSTTSSPSNTNTSVTLTDDMFLDDYVATNLRTITPWENAICYSGYRKGQQPASSYPTEAQVYADLVILTNQWKYIRMYDTGPHCETVLKVIDDYNLPLKVYMGVAVGYPASSWTARFRSVTNYSAANFANDTNQITNLFRLYNMYSNHILAVSVGNEILVDWSDHQVPGPILFSYLKWVRENVNVPVGVDEDIGYWSLLSDCNQNKKYWTNIINAVDYIGVHIYPCKIQKWQANLTITNALEYSTNKIKLMQTMVPNRQVLVGEGGWATGGTFEGVINPSLLCETNQKRHYNEIVDWASNANVLYFWFEAFDEYWKGGSSNIEIYWGLFFDYGGTNRAAKYAMYDYYTNCEYDIGAIPWLSSYSNVIDTNRTPKWIIE